MLTHANTSHESSERLIVASRHTPFLRSTKTHTLLGAAVTRACVRGSDTTYIRMGEVLPASPPSLTRSLSPSVWLGRCVRPFGGESGRSEWNGFPASGPLQWKLLGVKDRLSQSVRKLFSAPSSSRTVFFFLFLFLPSYVSKCAPQLGFGGIYKEGWRSLHFHIYIYSLNFLCSITQTEITHMTSALKSSSFHP